MANKLYEESSIQDIATAIRAKGVSGTMTVSQMAAKVAAIPTKQTVTWNQCPSAVKNYLANVTYSPSDYSTSQIASYAPATAVASNTKPIGKTIDGVTYYNEVPNVPAPFSSANTAGTVKPLDRLRWINSVTENVRDLGGWQCDGGTVKYGMLFRGGESNAADKSLMVDSIGIKHELQLRGEAEQPQAYSVWGIPFTGVKDYAWMSLSPIETWKTIFRCTFDTVNKGIPLYFHCAAGADRTGTVAVMLEALLGMSQSDIDKDYELSCFLTGTGTDTQARRRNESDYKNYIAAIKAVPLVGGLSDTFRNRAVSFALSLGFTIDEVNAFRAAMINGNPSVITVSLNNYSVTKNGANITFDNSITNVDELQSYKVNLTASAGYVISDVSVKMGGQDIFVFDGDDTNLYRRVTNTLTHCTTNNSAHNCIDGQSYGALIVPESGYTLDGATVSIIMGGNEVSTAYYKNGAITIPKVTGDIVISVTAVQQGPSYTNIWATPYKLNSRLNSSETDPSANGMYISAWFPVTAAQMSGDIVLRSNKDVFNYSGKSSSGDYFRMYPSATPATSVVGPTITSVDYFTKSYDSTSGIYTLTVKHKLYANYISQINYFRFCAAVSTSAISASWFDGCILTINEPIE